MIPLENCIVRSNNVVWRMLDGEAVIMSEDGKEIHTLNKVASVIWELADGEKTVDQIVAVICDRFDVEKDVAQGDILKFIQKLVDQQLLQNTT